MKKSKFEKLLSGGDLRSIGNSDLVVLKIKNQKDFDELFKLIIHSDRVVSMRAADAIAKISVNNTQYLLKHKEEILRLLNTTKTKDIKWHLALLIPGLDLKGKELNKTFDTIVKWALDKTNSRIVRVNSIQALFEMSRQNIELKKKFSKVLIEVEKENIPSINARIRIIRRILNGANIE